jgi:hypothetical protein
MPSVHVSIVKKSKRERNEELLFVSDSQVDADNNEVHIVSLKMAKDRMYAKVNPK